MTSFKLASCITSKAALIGCLSSFSGFAAYCVILGVLFACGLGVPIPEDITLVASGILAALGKISLWGAIVAGLVGVMVGDSLLFFLGRRLGRRVFNLPLINRMMSEERIITAERKVVHNSKFICFIARFLPGLRAPIFLTAGVMGVRPIIFFALDGSAALLSVPAWVVVGWWFGNNLDHAIEIVKQIQIYLIIGVVLVIGGYIYYNKRVRKKSSSVTPSVTKTENGKTI